MLGAHRVIAEEEEEGISTAEADRQVARLGAPPTRATPAPPAPGYCGERSRCRGRVGAVSGQTRHNSRAVLSVVTLLGVSPVTQDYILLSCSLSFN